MLHSARMAAGDDTVMGELPEPDSVATYGVGEDQVRVLLRCEISTLLTAALGPAVRKQFSTGLWRNINLISLHRTHLKFT